ncbi:hypothetical protein [Celerinatantimonas sp. YJH-8]|uniref:hypothetical protein n=1 Tax=Celerinatantimonas sp. YJH-8 TaxID=3228714 RepID=UPI0038C9A4EF
MNTKEIKRKIEQQICSGVSKTVIFEQLTAAGIPERKAAFWIASYAKPELIRANQFHVRSVFSINVIIAVLAFLAGFSVASGISALFAGVLLAIIPALLSMGFYKNLLGSYQAFIILTIVGLPRLFERMHELQGTLIFALLLNVALLGYICFVRIRIFPDMHWFGPRKKNGHYIFTD